MKKVLVVITVLAAMAIWCAVLVYGAGSYGTSGTRLYKLRSYSTYDFTTGYSKQTGSFQQIMHWWVGTTDVKDTLIDTVYTGWYNLGGSGTKDLYSMKVIPRILTVDTVASWDSLHKYTFALQTCLNPYTSDSLNISTIPVFVALEDTGTKVWFCPADSGLLHITYWTPYVRSRIIVEAKIDTACTIPDSLNYDQSFYIPIEYEVLYKASFR